MTTKKVATVLPRVVVTDKKINVDYYERYQFISSSSIGEFWYTIQF